MLSRVKHGRRAFTLAEVIVSITLVAILSAVVIPSVRGRMQDGYENALIQEYTNLAAGVNAYRQDIGKYPQRLDYLTAIPAQGTAKDFCGNVLSATDWAKWRGPYVSRTITNTDYLVAQSDTVSITMTRPVGFLNTLQIQIYGMDLTTAQDLDLKIDGFGDRLNGGLQYSPNGQAYETRYIIPTRASAC